jgi:hypothetical protein
MKSFCCFVAIAVCLGLAGVAHASSIDFAANILDPLSGGVPEFSNTFSFSFVACSTFSNLPSGVSGSWGCFEGMNATGVDADDCDRDRDSCVPDSDDRGGQTWTSLMLTFANTSAVSGQTADCALDSLSGLQIFATDGGDCDSTADGNTWMLDWSGGNIDIKPGDSFFIIENDGANTLNFPTVSATANAVPEPDSALLLTTGAAMFGLLLYAERRRLRRQSMNS